MFTFTNNIVSGDAAVSAGVGNVAGSPAFSGNTMTVNLSGVVNGQTIIITLSSVTDQFAQVLPETEVRARMLIGDANGSGAVNASDVGLAKSQIGQAVGPTNFRSDVNANGSINSTDVAVIKASIGTEAP